MGSHTYCGASWCLRSNRVFAQLPMPALDRQWVAEGFVEQGIVEKLVKRGGERWHSGVSFGSANVFADLLCQPWIDDGLSRGQTITTTNGVIRASHGATWEQAWVVHRFIMFHRPLYRDAVGIQR